MLKTSTLLKCSHNLLIDFAKNIQFQTRSISSCIFAVLKTKKSYVNILKSSKYCTVMDNKRIAVCQMTSTADKANNLKIVTTLVEEAVSNNVQMIFFPEACDYLCENISDTLGLAEPLLSGPTFCKYRDLAKKHNMWMSIGGIHELNPNDTTKMFNTHIIINNQGEIMQAYRKLHLFDVEIPDKNLRLKESDSFSPGNHIVMPVKTPVGNLGLATCYDLRFPELGIQLSALGADIITYPSAFTYTTGQAHWEILLRCRAIENQCYVIAAAQIGQHNEKRRSYGHAMCINPWGDVLATCGDKEDAPCLAIADIDYQKLANVRRDMPLQQHRRADVYKIISSRIRKNLLPFHVSSDDNSRKSDEDVINPIDDTEEVDEEYFWFNDMKIRASTVFYQTALSYAFVNIRCVVPGHVLVAPKRIVKRTYDLNPQEVADFFQTVIKVQKVMEQVHNATSSNVTVQDGPDAGQTVEHVHCHIMPRKKGDFKDVDMIYTELAKHDAKPLGTLLQKPARSLEERRSEAAMLRALFEST